MRMASQFKATVNYMYVHSLKIVLQVYGL